jgi:PAS domain S-box-containing protein
LPFIAALMIVALAVVAMAEVYRLQLSRRQEAARSEVVAQLGAVRARLEGALIAPLLVTRGLVAEIIDHGDIEDGRFHALAAILMAEYPSIRNFTLARGTVIAAVYPQEGNRAVLGVDYRDRPTQWLAVERAMISRKAVVAGPVPLIQGGTGLIGRVPIFLAGKRGGSDYFGMLSVVIDEPAIFAGAGISQDLPIRLAIRGHDGLGAAGAMIWGPEAVFSDNPVEMDVTLPDGSWRLAAVPRNGWGSDDGELELTRLLGGFLLLVVTAASFGTALYAHSLRRARGRIAESEERYRALVETAPMAVCVHRDGTIIFANSEAHRMLRMPDDYSMTGMPVMALIHPDSRDHVRSRIGSIQTEGGVTPPAEHLFIAHDGQTFNVEAVSSRVMLDGQPAVLSVVRDVTLRHQAEAERERLVENLRRSNDDLLQFAYIASHDLQEPLRNVASYVQLLGRRYRGRLDADADQFIDYAVAGVKRMRDMISSLLDYSRLHQGDGDADICDAQAVLGQVLADLAPAITETRGHVEVTRLPMVLVRTPDLARIFQNLVANAIKYHAADRPPVVRISARLDGSMCEFLVADNGIGIDPQYQERVFALFQRLHSRATFEGTGIGLAVCRKLVQNYGGRIWVETNPEGGGSLFFFTLPLAESLLPA